MLCCPWEATGYKLNAASDAQSLDAAVLLLKSGMLMAGVKPSTCLSLVGIRILPASVITSASEQFLWLRG